MVASDARAVVSTTCTRPSARSMTTPRSPVPRSGCADAGAEAPVTSRDAAASAAATRPLMREHRRHPITIRATSHSASASDTKRRHGGIAVPGRPDTMVATRLAAGFVLKASGVSAGPRPPVRRIPWQEPQSCFNNRRSSRWRAASGAARAAKGHDRAASAAAPAGRRRDCARRQEGGGERGFACGGASRSSFTPRHIARM